MCVRRPDLPREGAKARQRERATRRRRLLDPPVAARDGIHRDSEVAAVTGRPTIDRRSVVLSVANVGKVFGRAPKPSLDTATWALRRGSLELHEGETLGLVGESGSGKSTLARCILQLVRPTTGTVTFGATELTALSGTALREARSRIGLISQDPYSALNPRWRVEKIIRHPLET